MSKVVCLDVFLTNLKMPLPMPGSTSAALYKTLYAQDRVWDFRDIVLAAFSVYGPKHWDKFTRGQINEEEMMGAFAHNLDEVSCLALLDLLASTTLESDFTADCQTNMDRSTPNGQFLVEYLMKNHPDTLRSRPYLRWLLIKTAESGRKDGSGVPDSFAELFRNLGGFKEHGFLSKGLDNIADLCTSGF